ncbi:MAG: lytic murein transglycosylase [Alphaproteobacteria bacterium]|nr:lytic murein transglycosylase [Alphaproteobacteria bacterium]
MRFRRSGFQPRPFAARTEDRGWKPLLRKRIYLCTVLAATLLVSCAHADPLRADALSSWLQQTEQQAIDSGIAPGTVHEALDAFVPDPRVVELDQKQPETTISFETYRHNTVTAKRIEEGAELMHLYARELNAITARTGVPPQITVALWGIESSFGKSPGNFETVTALATLAYEGRRADFFRSELIASLRILEREHIPASELRGSWAGAMGQCQFMPSTYLKYAVDGDGDGKIDIWNNPVDALASIATYLAAEGWQRDLTWGREVEAADLPATEIGLSQTHSLAEWAQEGVTNIDGTHVPQRDLQASLLQPDGSGGASFLAYDNIRALMRWNRSTYFALSVGLLADEIRKEGMP